MVDRLSRASVSILPKAKRTSVFCRSQNLFFHEFVHHRPGVIPPVANLSERSRYDPMFGVGSFFLLINFGTYKKHEHSFERFRKGSARERGLIVQISFPYDFNNVTCFVRC